MSTCTRREWLKLAGGAVAFGIVSGPVIGLFPRAPLSHAAGVCELAHPLSPPRPELGGQCPNCGMVRPMWARTWKRFTHPDGFAESCSFHCLAEINMKSGVSAGDVSVALFEDPERFVPAGQAFFLVGASVPGTMSPVSKVAFADRDAAVQAQAVCGGELASFEGAYRAAEGSVLKENEMIDQRRRKMGKIQEPEPGKTPCVVCGRQVADHPMTRCQVQDKAGTTTHLCSTNCLAAWMAEPAKYNAKGEVFLAWVTDHGSGSTVSARTAYFVTGSDRQGPLGPEAFAFYARKDADAFAGKHGGRVIIWQGLDIAAIERK